MKHLLPELPYQLEALAPKMSKETLEYHYGKHLQTYIDNLNKLIAGTPYEEKTLEQILLEAEGPMFNNAAQTWNHTFFFDTLTPQQPEMPQPLADALTRDFGSVETFKEKFTQAATTLFGSGWTWLVSDKDGHLSIVSESNAILDTGGLAESSCPSLKYKSGPRQMSGGPDCFICFYTL